MYILQTMQNLYVDRILIIKTVILVQFPAWNQC